MLHLPKLSTRHLRGDIFGGVTAAVVALPLALAFGVSSGAGAIAGLYSAVFVGFFAALFGGTPSQISGPTGPMTVVMATVFAAITANDPENGVAIAFTVVMLGGLFQVVFGILRLGRYITLMPYTVISGFMSGIGFIILCLEIGPFFGHEAQPGVIASLRHVPEYLAAPNWAAVGLGILTLVIVFGAPAKLNRILPSPLIALIVCTLISVVGFIGSDIPRIGEIPSGLPQLHLPQLTLAQLKTMVGYGLMLAALGAIDSLLTSLVADNITSTQHDPNQELVGQGIANVISGLFGGLPGAGATMRTVINVHSGGKTSLSGMIHALVLLTIVLGAGPLTAQIPHTVLAGILIKVGIDIIDWEFLGRAHKVSLKTTGIMYLVLLLTVFVDLIAAVALGVFVANLLTIERLSKIQSDRVQLISTPSDESDLSYRERELLTQAQGRILLFRLGGPMSFGAAKSIARRMAIVENYAALILDLGDVPFLGVTAALAVENMVKAARSRNCMVLIVGAEGEVFDRLQRLNVLARLGSDCHIHDRLAALEYAVEQVDAPIAASRSDLGR
ncbi:MAG: SulP family inorganic anion transporter [Spirulinaceae cyanobacterium]